MYYIIVRAIQVLEVLSSSPELLGLLHKVDAACHSRLVASSPASDEVLKYVPSIREQLKVGYALLLGQLLSFKWRKKCWKIVQCEVAILIVCMTCTFLSGLGGWFVRK
jgi:hypothetical protein